jgi:hypothetical protein
MIGIFAPYNRGEVTAAAIRLANLCLNYGADVRLASLGPQLRGVHPYWDQRVWSTKGQGVYYAAKNCQSLIHFQPSPQVRKMCELVADKAKHIFVPQMHQLREDDAALMQDHHAIVCPTATAQKNLLRIVFQGIKPSPCELTYARFDSGLPKVQRQGMIEERMRLCVLANASIIESCGSLLLTLLTELMEVLPKLVVTLLANRAWNNTDRQTIVELAQRYRGQDRFRSKRVISLDEINCEFHQHDWTFLPWTKGDFGVMVTRSLSCGAPVIAFNVEPFNELIVSGHNGLLIPCKSRPGPYDMSIAVPNREQMLETLLGALANDKVLCRLQAKNWNLEQHEMGFTRYWGRLLDLYKE